MKILFSWGSVWDICSHLFTSAAVCSCSLSAIPPSHFLLQVYESKLQELQEQVNQIAETPDDDEEEEEEEEGKPLWKLNHSVQF